MPVKPRALRPGARLRLVAPASAPVPERLDLGARILRDAGFDVELDEATTSGAHARGYLAAPDAVRAEAVMRAFADDAVDGVVCSNGGYGSNRMLRLLDFDAIRANPKPFLGFSDVTSLLLAFEAACDLVTLHGPMPTPGDDFGITLRATRDHVVRALTTTEPLGRIDAPAVALRPGRASGRLVGGNLTLLAATLGTPWEVRTEGRVLFLEEWKEPVYTLDTMLHQLKHAGKLDAAAAVVFGEFPDCGPFEGGPSLTTEEVLADVVADMRVPVLAGLPIGHGRETLTLPIGVRTTVDADEATLTVDEAHFVA